MKALLFFFILFSSSFFAQAQQTGKLIKNPSSEKLSGYTDILNTDLVSYKEVMTFPAKVRIQNYARLDFNLTKENYFKLLRKDKASNSFWLKGFVDNASSKSSPNPAKNWIEAASHYLEIEDKRISFDLIDKWSDLQGNDHYRMIQLLDGIPVYNAEILLHESMGKISLMNGIIIPENRFNNTKSRLVGEEDAKSIARKSLKRYKEDILEFSELSVHHDKRQWETRLVYYPWEGEYLLAYHIEVYANDIERYEYFINASDGNVIEYFENICKFHPHHDKEVSGNCHELDAIQKKQEKTVNLTSEEVVKAILDGPTTADAIDLGGSGRVINTYEVGSDFFLIDASRDMFSMSASALPDDPIGAIWTIDLNNTSPVNENSLYTHVTSTDNAWANTPEGVSAHFNAGLAYEYFKDRFGRESITGTGQSIISFVNVTDEFENSMGNAFWNGIGIYYGNGDSAFESLGRALDVAGHEMSHGVIESTANLEYRNESGAMNEAFADIFGAMIDREDWLIGEDVVKLSAFPSGALRDMSDPHNGAATGDFNSGWQPRHYDERYTGTEDNGGVHINSGIINHAYYLFAQDVGRDAAEQVFYRALSTYLVRSSNFKELRFAVIQSAGDLYGQSAINAAVTAFDEVGIIDGSPVDVEDDYITNPGQDLLLVSDQDLSQLYLFNLQTGEEIYNPLSTTPLLSKPSITDDGSRIVYVGVDNHIHLIDLDWSFNPPAVDEIIISQTPDWRNAVISKDGRFLALLENVVANEIIVYDLLNDDVSAFELTNPTYSEGLSTGEVKYADVMEFDATGTSIMYDAFNEVSGNTGTLEFWDVGFVEVWNPQFDTWALGNIDKLFSNLPEGVNIGNPTFSKNSPYIIALDVFEASDYEVVGINLETQDVNSIFLNTGLGYPSYSRDDAFMVYDLEIFGYTDLGVLQLNQDKISRVPNSDEIILPGGKWGVWFSNGERLLSSIDEVLPEAFGVSLNPNPATDFIKLGFDKKYNSNNSFRMMVTDVSGRQVISKVIYAEEQEINISQWANGLYIMVLEDDKKRTAIPFVKE